MSGYDSAQKKNDTYRRVKKPTLNAKVPHLKSKVINHI